MAQILTSSVVGTRERVHHIVLIFSFTFLIALAAQVEIPTVPVPFTLQTLAVLLAGGILKKNDAFLSMLMYLGLGAVGLPVFAGGSFGIVKLLGPTGGYLIAFPVAAFLIASLLEKRKNFLWVLCTMSIGSVVIFVFGTIQLYNVALMNWTDAFSAGFFIFSLWDGVKILAAASIVTRYHKEFLTK